MGLEIVANPNQNKQNFKTGKNFNLRRIVMGKIIPKTTSHITKNLNAIKKMDALEKNNTTKIIMSKPRTKTLTTA